MILSISRRTDIPHHYTPWLLHRLREGYALVRNPMNPKQVSRLTLSPETIDGMVFWSKYPEPLRAHLSALRPYPFYFQFTLTGYGQDLEPAVPDKDREVVPCFLRLSEQTGPEQVLWRYDPVLLSDHYCLSYHLDRFGRLADQLQGATHHCTISFLDTYPSILKTLERKGLRAPTAQEQVQLAAGMQTIAARHGMTLSTCAEAVDLSGLGVPHGCCVDAGRLGRLAGWPLTAPKDPTQRGPCGCAQSVDLGAYNTCANGCVYCYASYRPSSILAQVAAHDPTSPLLTGQLQEGERVHERKLPLFGAQQIRMM